ncbi:MAG: DUF2905 domain-containing protein [Candidatus Omnitrophica bacterium]|nr:DUF2905 domain-containing protein [Candidatus Omnitrophota bacterium]
MSRWLIGVGLGLVFLGVILNLAPWLVNWIGQLPGDIRIENERIKVYVPITSMIILSLLLTLLLNLLVRR